jgi:hypothetical protein
MFDKRTDIRSQKTDVRWRMPTDKIWFLTHFKIK